MDGWTDRQIERNETKKIVTMLPPPPPSSPFFLKTHTEKEKKNSNAILFFTSMLVINDANAAAAANTYCRIQTFIANIFFFCITTTIHILSLFGLIITRGIFIFLLIFFLT